MKNKKLILIICFVIVIIGLLYFVKNILFSSSNLSSHPTTTASVKFIDSTITAEGTITAQSQATLHFQTAGKLIALPFKEGSAVKAGQTIASLDSYAVQKQLQAALNTYRSVRNSFDQTKDNVQNNVQKAQLTNPYDYFSKAGMNDTRESAINDAIKRIVDQNQANLDNSVINVEIANYAFQFSTLTSPISGIILHQDVSVSGLNITPTTSFVVADPSTMVFRANVPTNNINYVTIGAHAEISIDGRENKIIGSIVTIYPQKVTLPNGESVYQVDIQSDTLMDVAKLDQTGSVVIKTNSENVALVPVWTVLGGNRIWVDENGKPTLRVITSGKIHGEEIEITNGLSSTDKIIINPKFITKFKYKTV